MDNKRRTDQAVKKATGKTWNEWFKVLDDEGARQLDYRQIIGLLGEKGYLENRWWQQEVTIGYEEARGKRAVGRNAGAVFQIDVQKTLPVDEKKAWKLITSPDGLRTWLGAAPRSELKKGLGYRTKDGTIGQFLAIDEGNHIRLSWHPRGWETSTTLQVRFVPRGDKTSIRFLHEKLAGERERERMCSHWQYVLDRLEELAATSA